MVDRAATSYNWTRAENDFCSWMMLNGDDLFPPGATELPNSVSPSEAADASPSLGTEDPLMLDFVDNKRSEASSTSSAGDMSRRTSENKPAKSKSGNPQAKKREERLIRNREIARNCRKRKREKFESMQSEIQKLREDKRQLELTVSQLQKAQSMVPIRSDPNPASTSETQSSDVRRAEFVEIETILKQYDELLQKSEAGEGNTHVIKDEPKESFDLENFSADGRSIPESAEKPPKTVDETLKEYEEFLRAKLHLCKELHSDFGNARESEIKFHMKQLEKLLLPNQLSKMTLWSLQQEDEFYDKSSNVKKFGGGLWNTLCNEFKLTKPQQKGLMSMRKPIRQQRQNMTECHKILKELDLRVRSNFESLRMQMDDIMTMTTPVQQARLLMWIEKNQACMYMLNSLWEEERTQAKQEAREKIKKENKLAEQEETERVPVKLEAGEPVVVSTDEMGAALRNGRTLQAMKALIEKSSK